MSHRIKILLIFCIFATSNVNGMTLIPARDTITPQHRNYTLYIIPEVSYSTVYLECFDYTITYNSQQNATHAWSTFSIPEGLDIRYKYKVYVYLLNTKGDKLANGTFRFIISDNLSDDQLWGLWDQYEEYEGTINDQQEIIDNQSDIIDNQNDLLNQTTLPGKSLEEIITPVVRNILLVLSGAVTISFIAFLGYTKKKKELEEKVEEYDELKDNFRSEVEKNRSGSMSLLATKIGGDGRPVPILSLSEERGAVKMLRDDPELPDFLQVIPENDEKNSLDHLKNIFKTDKYTSAYTNKLMYQLHCLNGIIKYCHNYGYTGDEGTLYPKGCTLEEIEEYRDKIYAQIRQYSDVGKYIPAAREEDELKSKVRSTFSDFPDPPKI